jgi:hypothetical protein
MQEMPDDPGNPNASGRLLSLSHQAVVQRHRQMLVVAGLVTVLAILLQVDADDQAAFCFLPRWPLPPTCMSRSLFGVECPGCGLTRSFIHLAHGDWQRSLAVHRVGWLLALAVILQFPYRLAALLCPSLHPLGHRIPKLFGMLLIAGLIGNWVLLRLHI